MKETIYHLDYETYSPQQLGNQKSVGAFRYASDPEARILVFAIAKGGEPPVVWDCVNGGHEALGMLRQAITSGALIFAHNAQFEHAVSIYRMAEDLNLTPPDIAQWRCTAAMARLAAIPSSLEECGAFLNIPIQKDKDGKRLIDIFCKPRKATKKDPRTRIMPADEPEEFAKFVEYCRRDVIAEQQIYNVLKKDFPLEGWALESFQSDLRMNTRGIPVNRVALEHALALTEEFLARMVPLFRSQVASPNTITLPITGQRKAPVVVDISDGFNPTQRECMIEWLGQRGFTGDNLKAETVEAWIDDPQGLTEQAQIALRTYSMVVSAAVKKVPAMLAMACEDGYVRGALMVFGAERTHRWTGKGMQPQNFARPRIKFTELAYDFICNGATLDEIESIFGNFFDVLVSVIRHFIQPHEGDCLQADYSSIEARVAPWLVGEQKTLDLFAAGEPIYELMASQIFGVPVEEVTSEQRFVGKQAVLGCSYNMGRPKFRGTCEGYGFAPPTEMVEEYKPRHKGIVQLKFAAFKAMKEAEYSRKGCAMPSAIDDERLMQLMIKAEKWNEVGIGVYDLKSGNLTDEQWVHLTYDDLADRAVSAWRASNPVIVASWRGIDGAAKEAIDHPGRVTTVGRLKFRYQTVARFKALVMKLPSGHKLVYPKARVTKNTRMGWGTQIEFWGVLPNSSGKWGWCSTYGGKLLENATQATAGDVMRNGMQNAENAGYLGFMLVHDEILTSMLVGQTHEELCRLLCILAPWMVDLPLAAEGGRLPFYKK